jgi:hypothetical protein
LAQEVVGGSGSGVDGWVGEESSSELDVEDFKAWSVSDEKRVYCLELTGGWEVELKGTLAVLTATGCPADLAAAA